MAGVSDGLPGYGSAKKKKKGKSKKKDNSIGGFLANLAGGTGDLLVGVASSPLYIGKAGYSDAKDAVDGGGFSSDLAVMGREAWKATKKMHGPLFRGDFRQYGQNIYDNPAQFLLDAATIVTLGGAGAGAVGAKAAATASAGSKTALLGERVAGLQRVPKGSVTQAARTKAIVAADGSLLIPKTNVITSAVTGKALYDTGKNLPRNPVVRYRKGKTEDLLRHAPARSVVDPSNTNKALSYFNPEERAARLFKADKERMTRRAAMKQTKDIMIGLGALPDHEKIALSYRHVGFRSPETYQALVNAKDELLASHQSRLDAGDFDKYEAVKLKRNIASLTDELKELKRTDVADAISGTNISDSALAVQEKLLDLSDVNQLLRTGRGKGTADSSVNRSRIPLEAVKASHLIPDDERLGTMSYSEPRLPGARKSKGRSVKGRPEFDFDKEMDIDAPAFMNGLYRRDPVKVVEQYAQEMNGVRSMQDFNYMLQVAEQFDAETHGKQIGRGYEIITPDGTNAQIAKDINEISAFYQDRIVPIAKKTGDENALQLSKLIEDWAEAVNSGGGVVVPSAVVRQLRGEAARQKGMVRRALEKPTKVWRDMTLSLKGSFYTNNALGNLMMGVVGYGPQYLKEILFGGHTIRRSAVSRKLDDALPDLSHEGGLQVLRDLGESEASWRGGMSNPLNWVHVLGDKFAGVGVKFTEENFRRAGLKIEIMQDAKRLGKVDGLKKADALDKLLNDTAYVDKLQQSVAGKMLDYSKLTPFERDVLRTAMPFWNFTRSIAGRTIQLTLDEPWKIQVMSEMSKLSARENQKELFKGIEGGVPPYLKGLVQTGKVNKDGTIPVASLFAANPFSAAGDLANQAASIASGETNQVTQSPLSSFNPFLKSGIEAVTGRDLFFDAPLSGSKADIYFSQLAKQFPQYGFYDKARHPSQNSVIQRNGRQILGQYMGLSTGTYDPAMMQRQLAINAYYDNLREQQAAKRAAKRKAQDRGPAFGLVDSARGKIGI
jgi:hypothetical protein